MRINALIFPAMTQLLSSGRDNHAGNAFVSSSKAMP